MNFIQALEYMLVGASVYRNGIDGVFFIEQGIIKRKFLNEIAQVEAISAISIMSNEWHLVNNNYPPIEKISDIFDLLNLYKQIPIWITFAQDGSGYFSIKKEKEYKRIDFKNPKEISPAIQKVIGEINEKFNFDNSS